MNTCLSTLIYRILSALTVCLVLLSGDVIELKPSCFVSIDLSSTLLGMVLNLLKNSAAGFFRFRATERATDRETDKTVTDRATDRA